ncbi:MAG TPA: indolepyruvate ferredoxin oxidoreductase subunit alpha [Spirochaetota bacterium]|nr:indolepyruvate ferredoxin oxidoreductase subunit alpha [Spirochaetota bacterium]
MSDPKLLTGNEAIARGAWEAGVSVACAYPGTPSTEILETIARNYPEIKAEWSVNEKTALETAAGAALSGCRTITAMKHVGLNVAADPLFSLSYMGVKGGLVIAVADDPHMYSSQNEQDSRHYGRAAKLPVLEPADSEEARSFTKKALAISEQFDTPVILRSETRISHSAGITNCQPIEEVKTAGTFKKNPQKYVMIPTYARKRHIIVEKMIKKLTAFAEESQLNYSENKNTDIGFITSGLSYNYLKEVMPGYSVLKLGMIWPLPRQKITAFANSVKRVIIIEELDPFLETEIKAMGIRAEGKNITGYCGELTPEKLINNLMQKKIIPRAKYQHKSSYSVKPGTDNTIDTSDLPARPPVLCPSCPHRATFYILSKLKTPVMGDIGCYTLAAFPPLKAIDTTMNMGAGVAMAAGMEKTYKNKKKNIAVIGDSTFLHSGITNLLNVTYNQANTLTVILDNRITAMTGMQENPASGYTLQGSETKTVDFKKLVIALGIKPENVHQESPYNLKEFEKKIKDLMQKNSPAVMIATQACALLKRYKKSAPRRKIDPAKCEDCGQCLRIGCPAICKTDKGMKINSSLCQGCSICEQICTFDAIGPDNG